MTIHNATRHTILAKTVLTPTSLKDQSIGLLAQKEPIAMLLHTRFGIHTLFMKYPIDVLILDKTNKVVAIKEHLKPNEYFMWNIKYNKVLELPQGVIEKTKTQMKDEIAFH